MTTGGTNRCSIFLLELTPEWRLDGQSFIKYGKGQCEGSIFRIRTNAKTKPILEGAIGLYQQSEIHQIIPYLYFFRDYLMTEERPHIIYLF